MTTKSEWHAVPPTTDEMMAFRRGELPAAHAARLRAWLDGNPDMALVLDQPFPEDDAKPGDADYLSEDELSKRWAAFQNDIRPRGRVVRFPLLAGAAALAASLAIVFAGLFWQQRAEVRASRAPVLLDVTQILEPENGRRGPSGGPHLLNLTKTGAVCILQLSDSSRFEWYRIEMLDAVSAEAIWDSEPTQPQDGGLSVLIPRTSLESGTYRIKVWGVNEAGRELVDTYLVRVPER